MTDPNHSAFPLSASASEVHYGLTKRELFAAMAMNGMFSSRGAITSHSEKLLFCGHCVAWADALIAELNKE